jgi:hypothetical protein
VAACGTSNDDRPATLSYITEAILAPTCGEAFCHSSFKQSLGYTFDTVDAARKSMINGLASPADASDPGNAALIIWVTVDEPFGLKDAQTGQIIGRMPWDAPLPNADVDLMKKWIAAGVPGAQCDPEEQNGQACNGNNLVTCTSDGNFGTVVTACSGATPSCQCGGGDCGCH